MKYPTGTDQIQSTCLPPEAYIQLIRNLKNEGQPKFRSSVYPTPKKPSKVKTK